jgi:hypothetical protein
MRVVPPFSNIWPFTSRLIGVGHALSDNPVAFAALRGIDGASWNTKHFDFVAFSFHVSKNSVELQVSDSRRIFKKAPSGRCFP